MGNGETCPKMKDVYSRSCRSCFIRDNRPWTVPVSLTAIMDIPEILKRFVPSFDTLFLGVKETEAEALTRFGLSAGLVVTCASKGACRRDRNKRSISKFSGLCYVAYSVSSHKSFAPQVRRGTSIFCAVDIPSALNKEDARCNRRQY